MKPQPGGVCKFAKSEFSNSASTYPWNTYDRMPKLSIKYWMYSNLLNPILYTVSKQEIYRVIFYKRYLLLVQTVIHWKKNC